jgi:hypothetical protein
LTGCADPDASAQPVVVGHPCLRLKGDFVNWSKWVRQVHRWVSVAFTVSVIFVIIVGLTAGESAEWAFYLPLLPLAALFFSGINLFLQPYAAKRRSSRRAS